MSNLLKKLYNSCNPLKPATPAQYVDCTEVRGGAAFFQQYQNELALVEGSFLCTLFSGHIGCGKSSELHHLAHKLEDPKPTASSKRYFPIILDASEYLDDYDVTPTDLLLAIVAEVAAKLKEKDIGELSDNYFVKRFNEIKKFFLSEVEIAEGELSLWNIKAKIQRLKSDPEARKKVRDNLLPQTSTILHEINTVFEEARLKLKNHKVKNDETPYSDFVLIVDNLEKIQRISGHDEGEASHKELFVERAPQLKSLNAHVIYTIPLSLVISFGPKLEIIYGSTPFVLPMIKIIERNKRKPYLKGRKCLESILLKRLGEPSLDNYIEKEALDWLMEYTGGHIRGFLATIQEACTYIDQLPITLKAAQKALAQSVRLFSSSIPASYWPKLAELELSEQKDIDNNDPDFRKMLEQIIILEYINGGIEEDAFNPVTPWYVVNPIVRELNTFKSHLEKFSKDKESQK